MTKDPVFKTCVNCDPSKMGFWKRFKLGFLILTKQKFLLAWWCRTEAWKPIMLVSEEEYDSMPQILEWSEDDVRGSCQSTKVSESE